MSGNLDLGDDADTASVCISAEALYVLKGVVGAVLGNVGQYAGWECIYRVVHKVEVKILDLEHKADVDISVYEMCRMPLATKVYHKSSVILIGSILDMNASYFKLAALVGNEVRKRRYGVSNSLCA